MSATAIGAGFVTVRPRNGRLEAALVGLAVAAILAVGGALVKATQVDNFEPRLFGWQLSSFYDLDPTDQAVYGRLRKLGLGPEDIGVTAALMDVRRHVQQSIQASVPWIQSQLKG